MADHRTIWSGKFGSRTPAVDITNPGPLVKSLGMTSNGSRPKNPAASNGKNQTR
ncbi:hypothetical protein [Rhizobium sp. M10]|uniref:hypothetical protein n=1 Tax=Rhizobium sp. M10 TaxID=1324586 RepID=UPI001FE16F29|nr:hypothetical protein [Rhizobium sp. M10]